jgi:hypothetical protein
MGDFGVKAAIFYNLYYLQIFHTLQQQFLMGISVSVFPLAQTRTSAHVLVFMNASAPENEQLLYSVLYYIHTQWIPFHFSKL